MSVEEIETTVQDNLNESTSGLVQFQFQELTDGSVTMVFFRDFIVDPYEPIIYDCDMNLIANIGIEAFQPRQLGGYPLVYPLGIDGKNFYTDVTAFLRFYKTLLLIYRQQEVEEIGIRAFSDKLMLQIKFR